MRAPIASALMIVATLLAPFASSATELTTKCGSGVSVSAEINPVVEDFRLGNKLPHLSANVRLMNTSQPVATFSTAMLILSVDDAPPNRAYVNSVASQVVDFSTIEVKKGQSLELSVYWPVALKVGATARKLVLSCAG